MSKKEELARRRAALAAKRARLSDKDRQALQKRMGRAAADTIVPAERDGPVPLSFAQQGMWLLDRLYPNIPAFHIPLAFRFMGRFSKSPLQAGLRDVFNRHEIFRTTFAEIGDGPVQIIAQKSEFVLPEIDLRGLDEKKREPLMAATCLDEADRPIDLEKGPLVRATLLILADDDHVLMLTHHHIIADGWSMGVFIRELGALFMGHERAEPKGGDPPLLPRPPLQFADYAIWQRRWLQEPEAQKQLTWWRDHLAGASPTLELPTDFPRPAVRGFTGTDLPFRLNGGLSKKVLTLARQEDASSFMFLLAVLHILLYRYTGQTTIVTGTQAANRERREVAALPGMTANILAIRTDPDGALSFREYLKRVRGTALDAFSRQEIPFELVLEQLPPVRDLAVPPVFQVMCNLQNYPRPELPGHRLSLSLVPVPWRGARYDLSLILVESGGAITGAFNYNTGLFREQTIQAMIHDYLILLEHYCEDPGSFLDAPALTQTFEQKQGSEKPRAKDNPPAPAKDKPPAPGRKTLKIICELFAEVLDLREVSPEDNFFELGGRSRQAAALASRLQKKQGVRISVRSIYRYPTPTQLGVWLFNKHAAHEHWSW